MAATTEHQSSPAAAPKIEVTINPKPAEKKDVTPNLARQNTDDSALSTSDVEVEEIRPRPARRSRRYSVSPVRIYNRYPAVPIAPMLSSSTQLLENVGYDGIADMPYPGRASIYLTTFPFTDRDVKKWSWLFAHGVEDVWLTVGEKNARDDDEEEEMDDWFNDGGRCAPRVARNRRREFDAGTVDVSSVYLSRALDTTVVPEETSEKVKYLIVVQNRSKPSGGAKLVTAESRKAAGIALYYESLTGNSIVFVGAVVGNIGKKAKKFKKAEGVDDAKVLTGGGVVGIIC